MRMYGWWHDFIGCFDWSVVVKFIPKPSVNRAACSTVDPAMYVYLFMISAGFASLDNI